MNLLLVGCSYKTTPIELREKLAFDGPKLAAALRELETRYASEAVVLRTMSASTSASSSPSQGTA